MKNADTRSQMLKDFFFGWTYRRKTFAGTRSGNTLEQLKRREAFGVFSQKAPSLTEAEFDYYWQHCPMFPVVPLVSGHFGPGPQPTPPTVDSATTPRLLLVRIR